MKSRDVVTLAVGAGAGAAIWALSPVLAGRAEPWDVEGPYYVVALALAGLASGAFMPEPRWAHYVGSVVGQLGYELLVLDIGPLFVLGIAFLLVYSLLFLLGASAGAWLRARWTDRALGA